MNSTVSEAPLSMDGESAAAGMRLVDHVSQLGLNYDPFDPDRLAVDFFSGAGRAHAVDQISHFCQFGSGVLVVESQEGAGQKVVLGQVYEGLSEESLLALDAQQLAEPGELFFRLLTRLEPDQPVETLGVGQVLAELRHLLQLESDSAEVLVVALKSAELLSDKVFGALLTLLQAAPDSGGARVKLLLWSEPGVAKRLDALGILDVAVNDLPLPPFSALETKEYVEFLLKRAGWSGEPLFSEGELDAIWKQSKGLPGRINAFARAILFRKLPDDSSNTSRGLPVQYMVLLVVLVCVLLMLFFYRGEGDWLEGEAGSKEIVPEAAAVRLGSADVGPATDLVASDASGQLVAPQDGVFSTDVRGESPRPPSGKSAQRESLESPAIQALSESNAEPVEGEVAVAGALESVVMDAPSEPAVVRESDKQLSDRVATQAADKGRPAESVPVPAVGASLAVKAERGAKSGGSESYLMGVSDSKYFLQVLAAGSKVSTDQFMARQSNKARLHRYLGRRSGADWYVVLVGPYSNRAAARAAIPGLPVEQRSLSPWPRSAKDVKSKIGEVRGF